LLNDHVFEVHAGSEYRNFGLVSGLRAAGAIVEIPTEGMRQGEQLAFYSRASSFAQSQARSQRDQRVETVRRSAFKTSTALTDFLTTATSPVTLQFSELERILGRLLPASARRHRAWWANSATQTLPRQWLAVGWRAETVSLPQEQITLTHADTAAGRAGQNSETVITDVAELAAFSFFWPHGPEEFESGWLFALVVDGASHEVRHGLGNRVVYGRRRVHTVTWLDGAVQVEGVEADDYPTTRALLSLLRTDNKKRILAKADVPTEYAAFEVVEHRLEIDATGSRHALAVKIREDDLHRWGIHAWLRARSRHQRIAGTRPAGRNRFARHRRESTGRSSLPAAPAALAQAVVSSLLAHGQTLAQSLGGGRTQFTPHEPANAFIHENPFAFLVAVIGDQGIAAERAWALPYWLAHRLGHLDPKRCADEPEAVRTAFAQPPKLHRFVNDVAAWISRAGEIVATQYGGNAQHLWSDKPSAAELRLRFDEFAGVGQKKAAMAVEILERDLHVPLTNLAGSDIAYDIHVRRVFLRTGLAVRDEVHHMVDVARTLYPARPGALDNPAWDVGRRWCHRSSPNCSSCPILNACPRLIDRGDAVRGI
jgi:uncharacterized HhH-GPD family protein